MWTAEYLNHACFINTIYVALSFPTIYFHARQGAAFPEGGKLKLILEERLAEMGLPMTVSEKRLLVLAILGILGFMVEPWTGVNAVYVLCLQSRSPPCPHESAEPFNNLNIVSSPRGGLHGHRVCGGRSRSYRGKAVSSIIPFLKRIRPHARRLLLPRGRDHQPAPDSLRGETRAFTPAFGELGVQMGVNLLLPVLRLRVRARSVLLPL